MAKDETTQISPDTVNHPPKAVPVGLGMAGLAEEIRLRAYALYEARGGQPDQELADWIQAENEVLERAFQATDQVLIPGPGPGPGLPVPLDLAAVATGTETPP